MAGKFVASRSATPLTYVRYGGSGNIVPLRTVTINGGHGLTTNSLELVDGAVLTPVSDDDLDFLLSNKDFLRHQERGFIDVIDHSDEHRAASELDLPTGSQPLDINAAQSLVDGIAANEGGDVELEEILPSGKKHKPAAK
jgi:hypothetical protein